MEFEQVAIINKNKKETKAKNIFLILAPFFKLF